MNPAYKENSILVMDDAVGMLESTAAILYGMGFEQIFLAEDGREGFEMTIEYAPDLVIADLNMPHMDGFEYCRKVRTRPEFKKLPIIVQTGVMQPEKRAEAIRNGATDVLLKPVSPVELSARVAVHMDRINLMRELHMYRSRVENELRQARRMQQDIMPSEEDMQLAVAGRPVALSSHFAPSESLSGDFWGVRALSQHQLAFYLVDFTGHGLLAALNTFRLHTLIHSEYTPGLDPGEYLTRLNTGLFPLLPSNHFATMFYGILDSSRHTLLFSSAASPPPLVVNTNGEITQLESVGLPLSVRADTVYQTQEVPFKPGDALLCYSDALIEVEMPGGGMFEIELLEESCRRLFDNKAEELARNPQLMIRHLLTTLHAVKGNQKFADDLTLLALGFVR